MGEYNDWLQERTRELPVSELVVGILPETPRRYRYTNKGKRMTAEYKAYLEDVRRISIMPTRHAIGARTAEFPDEFPQRVRR